MASAGFALIAGILSILSPCVLPLVPVVLSGAAAENRFAPFALAAGLAISLRFLRATSGAKWAKRRSAASAASRGAVIPRWTPSWSLDS